MAFIISTECVLNLNEFCSKKSIPLSIEALEH